MASRKPTPAPSEEERQLAWADGIALREKARQDAAPFADYQRRLAENEWAARVYYASHADKIEASRRAVNATAAPKQTRVQFDAATVARGDERLANIRALNAFRGYQELKSTNPVVAAARLLRDDGTIERGRALANENPDLPPSPPEAA